MIRVLLVTNMYPSAARPQFGVFVRDQLDALCELPNLEIDLFVVTGGGIRNYFQGIRRLRAYLAKHDFDLVHAHYGITGWVARLAGAKPLAVTFHGTDLNHPRWGGLARRLAPKIAQAIVVSRDLGQQNLAGLKLQRPVAIGPCGVNMERFKPIDQAHARRELGLDEDATYVLFPADPARPEKRFDRATILMKEFIGPQLLTLSGKPPDEVSLWINAADAVIVPSDYEGFGLATLEALACNVPVIATPTGIAPEALRDLPGTFCAEFGLGAWGRALGPLLGRNGEKIEGRERAQQYSSTAMAKQVAGIYRRML